MVTLLLCCLEDASNSPDASAVPKKVLRLATSFLTDLAS